MQAAVLLADQHGAACSRRSKPQSRLQTATASCLEPTRKPPASPRCGRSAIDARHRHPTLTTAGRDAFAPLDFPSRQQAGQLLAALPEPEQHRLLDAMSPIERSLEQPADPSPAFVLRPHRPGDIGWVVSRHGALYAAEYGWDARFEALVARIAADFIERFDAAREACWIAERGGVNVGCVFLVQARGDDADRTPIDGAAQLRMLIVDPQARGSGIGARLIAECERFAREAGYRRIVLWTQSTLETARGLYRKAGYRLTGTESHTSFGRVLDGESWQLDL